jgi:hypothetical protein
LKKGDLLAKLARVMQGHNSGVGIALAPMGRVAGAAASTNAVVIFKAGAEFAPSKLKR